MHQWSASNLGIFYDIYLCNYGTNTVNVATASGGSKRSLQKESTNVVVQWYIPSDGSSQKTFGTNNFDIVYEEDQNCRVTLRHYEATGLRCFDLFQWKKHLPPTGSITFVYEIPKSYGTRFDVWSGRLESEQFPVRAGKIALEPDDLVADTTVSVSDIPDAIPADIGDAIPAAIGAAREDVIKLYGEPTYWGTSPSSTSSTIFPRPADGAGGKPGHTNISRAVYSKQYPP